MLIYSKSGGMDIEDVTEAEIHKEYLDVREPALRPHLTLSYEEEV